MWEDFFHEEELQDKAKFGKKLSSFYLGSHSRNNYSGSWNLKDDKCNDLLWSPDD